MKLLHKDTTSIDLYHIGEEMKAEEVKKQDLYVEIVLGYPFMIVPM